VNRECIYGRNEALKRQQTFLQVVRTVTTSCTAIRHMLTQTGIRTMRHMFGVMTQLKAVTSDHGRSKWLTSFQFDSLLSETCCKASPHHSRCWGRGRVAFCPITTHDYCDRKLYRTEHKELHFFKSRVFNSTLNI
jgi:hypothetical protein